jgi:cystathionine beta-lyase/cystathionine gamma-synthase
MNPPIDIATRLLHMPAVTPLQPPTSPPIYPSVGFRFRDYAHAKGVFDGSIAGLVGARAGNPTAVGFETRIAALEGAEAALAVPSGMAAVTAGLLAFARAGESIVVDHVVYVGTYGLLREVLPGFGIEVRAVDTTDPAQVERAIDATTRAIFVESPGSWQLKIPDIDALAQLARSRGVRLIVDGTMATGYLQQPLALGADLVVYSATGYLNGHADAVLGVVAGSSEVIDSLRGRFRNEMGAAVAPTEVWVVNRSLATLALRLTHQCATTIRLAEHLERAPGVRKVIYPWLASHPQHALARRQMRGGGGILLFELADVEAVARFITGLEIIEFTVGIGGPITTVFCPAHSFPGASADEMEQRGVNERLVRLSIGLEAADDLVRDVDRALHYARSDA